MRPEETYLGDGLYAHLEGVTVWLRAPRAGEDHECALEPDVLLHLLQYVKAEQPAMFERIMKHVGT